MTIELELTLKPTIHFSGYFLIEKPLIKNNLLSLNKKYKITIEEIQ